MFTTGESVDLAKWIIVDTCHFPSLSQNYVPKVCKIELEQVIPDSIYISSMFCC